ncbi:MAG TPA: PepSY-associated TM helix domain-containing protein [Lysobacter sp.]
MTAPSAAPDIAARQQRRGFWLRTLHQWHWISSAICLVAMVLFSITGITLNHSSVIEAKPEILNRTVDMPASLLKSLGKREDGSAPLPGSVSAWLNDVLPVAIGAQPAEWSAAEVYVSLPRPGGDAWLSIDRATGAVEYERTSRGWIAYFNDLHKGRNAGAAWRWFIDIFAIACLVFCLTGLFLLQMHARQRPSTWPYVVLGLVLPLLLALLFIH